MNESVRILLAEDDVNLGFVVKDNLEHQGYRVDLCSDGEEALERFGQHRFDVCILDIMMPKKDGFAVAARIREVNTHVPILFLTARTLKEDRLQGFMLGGDDYITKPFSIEELVLRIQVFLKRSKKELGAQQEVISIGKYDFNHSQLLLKSPGKEKMLTQKEADILLILCQAQGRVVKRNDILLQVWGDDDYFNGRSLDVFISRLRKYIADEPVAQITNHHGVGFRLQMQM
ncbi:MAG: response regulator transcription factor [Cyclobacteriaceae bacterium]|nr:response regulator transcription factor [Cyclobacteriaceae bacterium]